MRVLVLGATGMLGHRLVTSLRMEFDIAGTIHGSIDPWVDLTPFKEVQLLGGVEANDLSTFVAAIEKVQPDVVINCIGLVKQRDDAKSPIPTIAINALLPHQIAEICRCRAVLFIHFSTDCVFSGRGGPYNEDNVPDAEDLYGRTKLLGEVMGSALTIRSSFIGRELSGHRGLLEWFLSNRRGRVAGYVHALYTGLTTDAMAEVVRRILLEHPDLTGLWQVAADPISKFDLLCLINKIYDLGTTVVRDEIFSCDLRLDGNRFATRTGIVIPDWPTMIRNMRTKDGSFYESLPTLMR